MEGLVASVWMGRIQLRINVESGAQNQCRVAWSHLGFLTGEGNFEPFAGDRGRK